MFSKDSFKFLLFFKVNCLFFFLLNQYIKDTIFIFSDSCECITCAPTESHFYFFWTPFYKECLRFSYIFSAFLVCFLVDCFCFAFFPAFKVKIFKSFVIQYLAKCSKLYISNRHQKLFYDSDTISQSCFTFQEQSSGKYRIGLDIFFLYVSKFIFNSFVHT